EIPAYQNLHLHKRTNCKLNITATLQFPLHHILETYLTHPCSHFREIDSRKLMRPFSDIHILVLENFFIVLFIRSIRYVDTEFPPLDYCNFPLVIFSCACTVTTHMQLSSFLSPKCIATNYQNKACSTGY